MHDLTKFFIAATTNERKSYRHDVENIELTGLTPIDCSTISSKAIDVNYGIYKVLFKIIMSKCNRQM